MNRKLGKLGLYSSVFASTLLCASAYSAELTMVTSYLDSGGNRGDLNAVGNMVNGNNICPAVNTNANGVAGCDMSADVGYSNNGTDDASDDAYAGDMIIRTNDVFTIQAAFSWTKAVGEAGPDEITLTGTLPAVKGFVFDSLPGFCDVPAGSALSADRKTITCVRKGFDTNNTGSYAENTPFPVLVEGDTPNNTVPGDITFSIDDTTGSPTDSDGVRDGTDANLLTVTAAPRWNIEKGRYTTLFGRTDSDGITPGYEIWYNFSVEVDEVSGEIDTAVGQLGNEALMGENDATITFIDDLSEVSPNAKLVTWDTHSNFIDAAFPTGLNPCEMDDYAKTVYASLNATYPDRSVPVPHGTATISCVPSGGDPSKINITLNHIDGTLTNAPRKSTGGSLLNVKKAIAAVGTIRIFVPLSDVENGEDGVVGGGDDGELELKNCITDFDPVGISTGANFGGGVDGGGDPIRESELDNCTVTTLFSKKGSWGKNFRKGWSDQADQNAIWGGAYWSTKTDDATSVGTGDGVITREGVFGTFQSYTNVGGTAIASPVLCDVIDTETYEMVVLSNVDNAGTFLDDSVHAVDLNYGSVESLPGLAVEYGTGYVGSWPPDPDETPHTGVDEVALECNDPGTWYPTLAAAIASNTGAVSKVRVSATSIPVTRYINMRIRHKARSTFLSTKNGHLAGDIIPENTLLVNYAAYKSGLTSNNYINNSYRPHDHTVGHQSSGHGDRIIMVNARARILKAMTPSQVQPGNTVSVTLTSSFTTEAPVSETDNVTIRDLLPKGLTYTNGSVTGAYIPLGGVATNFAEPVVISPVTDVLCNTHAADLVAQGHPCGTLNAGTGDESILIWDLGDQETGTDFGTLGFDTVVDIDAPAATLHNYASIESPADSSVASKRESNANTKNSVPTSLIMVKSVQTPLNEINSGALSNWMQFNIGMRNGSPSTALPNLDMIDLMPFNTDGDAGSFNFSPAASTTVPRVRTPASNFQGTFEFDDVSYDDNSGECTGTPTFWFTNVDPTVTTLDISPVHASNVIGGVDDIGWCGGDTTVASSLATCGFGKSAVTAVRVRDVDMTVSGTCFVNIVYSTTGNKDEDIYSNTASAKADNVTNAVLSNTVSARVYAGSIGDQIWQDLNNDGSFDAGEALEGVTVKITPPAGIDLGAGDGVAITTDTDNTGNYLFDELPAGEYTVEVVESSLPAFLIGRNTVDPDGVFDSTSIVTIGADEDNLDQDFAYYIPLADLGSIGDKVWHDINNDGDFDAGEGLNGIDVTLVASGVDLGNGVGQPLTIQTSGTGDYLFPNLIAGNYTVTVDETDLTASLQGHNTQDPDNGSASTSAVNLASGADDLDQDFGYYAPASIGDKVWHDVNNNGQFDAGEGINGVTVTLVGPGGTTTVDTNGDGDYLFPNLVAGNYTVTVDENDLPTALQGHNTVDPDAGNNSTSAVTIASGISNLNQDFGYYVPSSIGDKVWHDANNNGSFEAGEGLNGVTVSLSAPGINLGAGVGNPITVDTSGDGDYLFPNLVAGNYTVTVDQTDLPTALQGHNTVDPDGGNNSTSAVVLPLGVQNDTQDFAYFTPASIGDKVWHDINNNGVFDANEGLNGATVSLSAPGIDLGAGAGNPITVDTSGDGDYLFPNLIPGNYTVTVDEADIPTALQGHNTVDPDGGNNSTSAVTIAASVSNLNQDFGYYIPSSIGDKVWHDKNHDGLFDAGEGLNGVTVSLSAPGIDLGAGAGNPITVDTSGDGDYLFPNLVEGTYTVTVDETDLPAVLQGHNTVDPDATLDSTSTVVLPLGVQNDTQNFAYFIPSTIGDTVWHDLDNDGVFDTGEGINDVTVTLVALGIDLGAGAGNPITVVTSGDGGYSFTDLIAGDYTVTVDETTLAALLQGENTVDPDATLDSTSNITLDGLVNNLAQDFAYVALGSIGDTIWHDVNYDGLLDGGDNLLDGITVTLTPPAGIDLGAGDGVAIMQDTTIGGQYLFDNLPPGNYIVIVDTGDISSALLNSVDPDGGIDSTSAVSLAEGEDNLSQDFAYAELGHIVGSVMIDANGDGVIDAEDEPVEGVVLLLLDNNGDPVLDGSGTPITATTNIDGEYVFMYLPVGDYQVAQIQPQGLLSVSDIDGDNLDLIGEITPISVTGGNTVANQNFLERPDPSAIPTLSEWALFMLMMLLAFVGYRQSVLRGGVKF